MNKLTTLFILLLTSQAFAQQSNVELKSWVGLGDGSNPFWLVSNQYGLIESENSSINQFVSGYNYIKTRNVDYETKASGVLRYGTEGEAFVHELYFKAILNDLSLTIGKKEFRDGWIQNDVAIGSMLWSSNSPTMPMIMGSVDNWVDIPVTSGLFQFKGYLAHGWFEDDRYVEDSWLHMKALSLKLGKDSWPINFRGSLVHNVQWGGNHPIYGDLPDSFNDFMNVFFGQKGKATSDDPEPISFQGNTVGMTDYAIQIPLEKSEILLAKQFFIESRMGVRYRSPADGLWAFEWKNTGRKSPLISYFVYEMVNTVKQDSRRDEGEIRGGDQYYFNFLYRNGWTYKNRIIGLPLVGIQNLSDTEIAFVNNIILGHHIGFTSNLQSLFNLKRETLLDLRITYSRNYGFTTGCVGDGQFCDPDNQPRRTPRQDQWYSSADLKFRYNEIASAFISIGIDQGDLLNSVGALLGVQYNLR